MSRKVYAEITFRVVLNVNEGIETSDVINELDCSFETTTDDSDVELVEMIDYEIKDSK